MKYTFESIIERDTDFAIINAFLRNDKVKELFLNKIGRGVNEVIEVYHSLTQQEEGYGVGESDIVIVLKDDDGTYAIFIEDKINADAQPNQRERYEIRAKDLEKQGLFEEHYVFMCAPQSYLDSSLASKYERKVSYESIIDLLDDSLDRAVLLKGSEGGTTLIKSDAVTDYWKSLYAYVEKNYKDLRMIGTPKDKSANSLWPEFRTVINGCTIVMKSNRGHLDLEFSKMGTRLYELELKLQEIGVAQKPIRTGKSASIRIDFDNEDLLLFNNSFDSQIGKLEKWLSKVVEYDQLAKRLYEKGMRSTKD